MKISSEFKEAIARSGFMAINEKPMARNGHVRVDVTCDDGTIRTVQCPSSPGDFRSWRNFLSYAKGVKAGVR